MKKTIIKFGKMLYDKDLTSATSGNISIKQGNHIFITGTGTALGLLEEKDIVEIDMEGKELYSNQKASSEKFMHVAIYNKRPDINAIIHCHAPFTTAFAACRQELSAPITAENILYFDKIPVADYAMPSSKELVTNTAKWFELYDTVLMANHGIVAGADNILKAFYKIETAENYAKTFIYSKIIGNQIPLNNKEIKQLENLKKGIHS
ncbi:MAG: class II aldolase/adducin family protein [Candidatus Gastranaerophilaceae bacterium]